MRVTNEGALVGVVTRWVMACKHRYIFILIPHQTPTSLHTDKTLRPRLDNHQRVHLCFPSSQSSNTYSPSSHHRCITLHINEHTFMWSPWNSREVWGIFCLTFQATFSQPSSPILMFCSHASHGIRWDIHTWESHILLYVLGRNVRGNQSDLLICTLYSDLCGKFIVNNRIQWFAEIYVGVRQFMLISIQKLSGINRQSIASNCV